MGKNLKKVPVNAGKPITDFFPRVPPPSSGMVESESASSAAVLSKLEALPVSKSNSNGSTMTLGQSSTGSQSSRNGSKSPEKSKGLFLEAVEILSPGKSHSTSSSHSAMAVRVPSGKRPWSPENAKSSSSSQKECKKPSSQVGKFQVRRNPKFDSSSDVEQLESVVYVKRSGKMQDVQRKSQNLPRKKARISSPTSLSGNSAPSLIPSSQSDEEELAKESPVPNIATVKESVQQWHKQALHSTPDSMNGVLSSAMDVDDPSSSIRTTPVSELEIRADLNTSFSPSTPSSSVFNSILTPPYTNGPSDDVPMPPTPVALDAATKTAQIIAQIKKRALSNVSSSPETIPLLDVPDELEESSDDDHVPLFSLSNGDDKMVASNSKTSSEFNSHLRRSARHRPSLSASSRDGSPTLATTRRTRASLHGLPIVSSNSGRPAKQSVKKARYSHNPLDALLKEKKLANKRGVGDNAFRLAEIVTRPGRSELLEEMNLEELTRGGFGNDDSGLHRSGTQGSLLSGSLTQDNSLIEVDDVFLADDDRKNLFGDAGGKDIMSILESDRLIKREAEENVKVEGVSLWSVPSDCSMVADETPLVFEYEGNNVILGLLKTALHQSDTMRAALLLNSGISHTLGNMREPQFIHDLCMLALSWEENKLSEAAFRILLQLWNQSSGLNSAPGISSSCVIGTLVQVGADPSVLHTAGFVLAPSHASPAINEKSRQDVLYRLVALVTASAKSQRLAIGEISDLVMATLLISINHSTSRELRLETMAAIDLACNCIASENSINHIIESRLASRIVACVATYEPINKAFLLSFLAGGTGCTLRIARYAAYCILCHIPLEYISPATFADPPPLTPILNQLIQVKSINTATEAAFLQTPSVFTIHDGTDYVDLEFYVRILSIAMSNVKGYMDLERQPASPSKLGDKKLETELQLLHYALEDLHSGIFDTRAAHLDRSRTKAAVKGLQMRIYYQKAAWDKAGIDQHRARAGNLKSFFATKIKT